MSVKIIKNILNKRILDLEFFNLINILKRSFEEGLLLDLGNDTEKVGRILSSILHGLCEIISWEYNYSIFYVFKSCICKWIMVS